MASLVGNLDSGVDSAKGTDPKTGFVLSGGEVKTDHKGGDPKTGLFVPSGGEVKTDQHVPSGGEVKTDHASFDVQMTCLVGEMDDSPLPGWLETQTATPDPPACTESAISRAECPEHADGFSTSNFPAVPDGFPCISEGCESRDELPRSGVIHQVETGSMNSISDNTSTVFSGDFHFGEKSERLRESDFGVQIVPASRSPSELSAHQMGLSLAGTVRLKSEPISIDAISTLAIGESAQLSISDRALLRKYKSSGQAQEFLRQPETHKEITAAVRRVDVHPPEPRLSLDDRILLRKYSVPGTAVSPHVSLPIESTKKRRRFHQKGKFIEEVTKEASGTRTVKIRRALPVDFRPRLQSHLFELEPLFLILFRVLSLPTSLYCIIHWSGTELCLWGIYKNLCRWKHLHAKRRTGCKLQRLPFRIQLRLRLLLHFAESLNIELLLKNRLQISW